MLEILQFVFSSFWIWLGTVILIAAIGGSLSGIFRFSFKQYRRHDKKKRKKSKSLVLG